MAPCDTIAYAAAFPVQPALDKLNHSAAKTATWSWPLAGLWTLITAAILWPIFDPQGRDSFPLSSYPMFTAPRHLVDLRSVVVQLPDTPLREAIALPPKALGCDEVMQAAVSIRLAMQGDAHARDALCRRATAWVHEEARFPGHARIHIVRNRVETMVYWREGKAALDRQIEWTCPWQAGDEVRP